MKGDTSLIDHLQWLSLFRVPSPLLVIARNEAICPRCGMRDAGCELRVVSPLPVIARNEAICPRCGMRVASCGRCTERSRSVSGCLRYFDPSTGSGQRSSIQRCFPSIAFLRHASRPSTASRSGQRSGQRSGTGEIRVSGCHR